MKRELWSVWKDETSYGGMIWKVQFPRGIESYRTKRAATAAAEAWAATHARNPNAW